MADVKAIDLIKRLQHGEKVLCEICKKSYFDNSGENRAYSNYFHCEDPNCTGSVHLQKSIVVE